MHIVILWIFPIDAGLVDLITFDGVGGFAPMYWFKLLMHVNMYLHI